MHCPSTVENTCYTLLNDMPLLFVCLLSGKPLSATTADRGFLYLTVQSNKEDFGNINMEKTMVDNTNHEALLKVKSSSSAANLAAAIANNVYAGQTVTLRAIGAAAVNQSMKAIAIAQSYVGPRGMILSCRPGFTTVTMDDGDISAMIFLILVN